MIKRIKNRLAHVKSNSLRFRLVDNIWGYKAKNAKACMFYWVMIPTSLVASFFYGLIIFLYATLGAIGGFIIGRPADFKSINDDSHAPFHEYGYNPITKKTNMFALGNYVLAAMFIALIVLFQKLGLLRFFAFPPFWFIVGTTVGFVVVMLALGVGISFLVEKKGDAVKSGWNRICPDLVVEDTK